MKNPKEFAADLKAQIEKLRSARDNASQSQVNSVHQHFRKLTRQFDGPGPKMQNILNFEVPDDRFPVPVRLYEPFEVSEQPGPTIIYFHGGGFVTCDLDSHEGICLRLACGTGFRVLSVDYRLAPQYAYPAGPEDCERVVKWALSGAGETYGICGENLAVGGDSAGGNMAAFLAQKYRKELLAQILFYPLMQLAEIKPPNPGPQDILQLGVIALKFIDQHYVAGADTTHPRLSPLFERDLIGVPPAYILTCGLDPLRFEGKVYADNLAAAGVRVTLHHEKAMPHGFLNFSRAFPKAKKIPLDATDFLRHYMSLSHSPRQGASAT